MSYTTLMTLAELHFECGLIGIVEFTERCDVAAWVFDQPGFINDPRRDEGENQETVSDRREAEASPVSALENGSDQGDISPPDYLHFTYRGWVFTKADPDPYPSTPHGHWQDQNRTWPKMDPYNGRVFNRKNAEAAAERLSKGDLRTLWSDERFKDFCRGHIVWFMEEFPHHRFRVPREYLFRWPRI
ncbi:hypothetical protein [Rhizobium leguminosarum]|uniref:hypothetical protein n=1 Tax=Rhizobium leguminosarum TaxID=384 RepID=UPI00103F4E39|nr:hypothetical protein [Rhizobium leguminosarum]MBY5651786.1 hypothetical protein [Rhizobium leguminosarum]TBZ06257.1 hypothetical protein E0H38_33135 [Rhizobium leguminosarum bv. viciae]